MFEFPDFRPRRMLSLIVPAHASCIVVRVTCVATQYQQKQTLPQSLQAARHIYLGFFFLSFFSGRRRITCILALLSPAVQVRHSASSDPGKRPRLLHLGTNPSSQLPPPKSRDLCSRVPSRNESDVLVFFSYL